MKKEEKRYDREAIYKKIDEYEKKRVTRPNYKKALKHREDIKRIIEMHEYIIKNASSISQEYLMDIKLKIDHLTYLCYAIEIFIIDCENAFKWR